MSPDASPGSVSAKTGVRRVNNVPVYIGAGVLSGFLLIMLTVAADRSAKQSKLPTAKPEVVATTNSLANAITEGQQDGIIQPKSILSDMPLLSTPGQAQSGPIAIARPDNLDLPPPGSGTKGSSGGKETLDAPPIDGMAERIRTAKLQALEAAVKSKTNIPFSARRAASSGAAALTNEDVAARIAAIRQQIDLAARDNPTEAYKARLEQLRAAGLVGGAEGQASATPALLKGVSASGKDYNQLSTPGQEGKWQLDSQPTPPRSRYELRAGYVIPATLIYGINSELPGQIAGQVSQDVFDTATGKYKLIPQGSRLVGRYSSEVVYGQSRVLVAWNRIVFPDGKAMDIGAMPGADNAGYAGLTDQVNNHYIRLFSSAFLMSGITAGIALSQPQSSNTTAGGGQTASGAMSEAVGQQLGQATAQLIGKNMGVSPTLEIRPGYRFNVTVTKDMTFSKPYNAFDY
jgi:type IV secretion system protein VirB10